HPRIRTGPPLKTTTSTGSRFDELAGDSGVAKRSLETCWNCLTMAHTRETDSTAVARLLDIRKGDAVSFVGAGGKTSLMKAFARDLSAVFSVAVTTTTKMRDLDEDAFASVFAAEPPAETTIRDLRASGRIPAFFAGKSEDGKCLAPDPAAIRWLAGYFDILLIEADGARGMSLKFPRSHEPVVPEFSKKVVWVVGLDALGKRMHEAPVFDIDGFVAAGIDREEVINVRTLRRMLYSAGGYLDKLAGKQVSLCLNKCDLFNGTEDDLRGLFENRLSLILTSGALPSAFEVRPVDNRDVPICAVVLCAGRAERFGGNKLTADYAGRPLALHALEAALGSAAERVYTIVNGDSGELRRTIQTQFGSRIAVIENARPQEGLSSSVKLAARKAAADCGTEPALMFFLGDMPLVTAQLAGEVVERFKRSCALVCSPCVGDRPGHPVLVHPRLFPDIMRLDGDVGCREIIRTHSDSVVRIEADAHSQTDVDFRDDLISGVPLCRNSSRV
ncbi:MAG: selenium cofactor biosynthesis protein YqeC, partial [Planctomycetota bacterium]|nr:selenium cofactor biosynthesis protein YqeC [Planctomycetota bacterium]